MPEKTARWTTMSDGIPNDGSGGPDYAKDQPGAHPIPSITHGVSTAATRIGPGRSTRLRHLRESLL
jgi:hypothetical protein